VTHGSRVTGVALFLGRLVRPTVERPHPVINPPLLTANLQSNLRAVGPPDSSILGNTEVINKSDSFLAGLFDERHDETNIPARTTSNPEEI